MSLLYYELMIEGVTDESLVVHEFTGYESLSSDVIHSPKCNGFRFDIALASRKFDLSPNGIVDQHAQLSVFRDGECVLQVHGIVRSFSQGDIGKHHAYYSLTLVPSLERLSLRHNSRIFQQQSVVEIITQLLDEMEITDYTFAVSRDYQPREYCVQYRETDLAFVERLAAEEGLFYYFEHTEGQHTLVFTDNSLTLKSLDSAVVYNNLGGGVAAVPYISTLSVQTRSDVAEVTLEDKSFKKPNFTFSEAAKGELIDYQRDDYAHYDYPARFKDQEVAKVFSQVRLEYLRREAITATGNSDQAKVRAGSRFALTGHLNEEWNTDWVAVSVQHHGKQKQALEENANEGATEYHNSFMLIPASVTWRPTPQPKPQVDGSMTAVVVGPDNEEIYCDEHGRVRVHFPWDRYNANDDSASCWIRVSQQWAGSQYGSVFIPRVGNEVIVSFLNGDPDQPLITGATYDAIHTTPYALPEHKTKSVLRSETHQGEGYNELSFEDQAGSEQIYFHAQRDFVSDILNDQVSNVKNDQRLVVERDQQMRVKNNHEVAVDGESRTLVEKDLTSIVKGQAHYQITDLLAIASQNEISLKSGSKTSIDAGSELNLMAGGSSIKLSASGVSICGASVGINSGGGASSGRQYAGTAPTIIDSDIESPAAPVVPAITQKEAAKISLASLASAEASGASVVKTCPLQKG